MRFPRCSIALSGILVASCTDATLPTALPAPSDAGDAAARDASVAPREPPEAGLAEDASVPEAKPDAAALLDAGAPPVEPPYDPVTLSETDRSPEVRLDASGLSAEWRTIGMAGVRSNRAIAPGDGVFYFEATIPTAFDLFTIGVASAAASLTERAGATEQSFGLDTGGHLYEYGGARLGSFLATNRTFGFVVDYSGANPVVHVILEDGSPRVRQSAALTGISAPLYIHIAGTRRTTGTHVTINPGNDTVNRPFRFDPVALLREAGLEDTAEALVLGFGGSHASTWNEPPVVAPFLAPVSVPVGTSATLAASAFDAEDGLLSSSIVWEVLSTGYGAARVRGTGPTFTFAPAAIGTHPVRLTVLDSGGKEASAEVTVTATGTLPRFTEVRMTPEATSGRGIVVSDDGLRVRWTENAKYGIRANQGIYGQFWYFEGHRLVGPENQGVGLVVGGASLDPYVFNDTPPSCSLNAVGGVYRDLIYQVAAPQGADTYGFAVDYRGAFPIVYVIVSDVLLATLRLTDATVPIYPMLYGNPTIATADWDAEINFGGAPFRYDPARVLSGAGIDASSLVACWGDHNEACP